ncbi:hypothetical protein [Polaribacter sp. KT 15]|uniref:hypothetical protein n=1 Tax=Polaribacter sp. KT 15 TaxID=1896175 RepID=UPI000909D5B5|nr:hypothetical protein [Polaribacter sp. KT 15]SHN08233.1 hypothetical protein SAMN05720268_2759 [Polaribacter sp. KT 15]
MRKYIGYLFLLIFVSLVVFRIYSNIIIKQQLTGHLKRAADANSIELALNELKTALEYIEENKLTSGYTSIIYKTPDEDLSFWYSNLKASKLELEKTKNSTSLEKTNVLLKLRETLLDEGEKGSRITYPKGISIFPNNRLITILFIISLIFIPIFFVQLIKWEKEEKRKKKEKKKKKKLKTE